uniref:Putative secreted protein n=1 Tax=Ixodes scapularis TaxID=6945 RepID=A0A4D5RDE3_IXOSC
MILCQSVSLVWLMCDFIVCIQSKLVITDLDFNQDFGLLQKEYVVCRYEVESVVCRGKPTKLHKSVCYIQMSVVTRSVVMSLDYIPINPTGMPFNKHVSPPALLHLGSLLHILSVCGLLREQLCL